MRFIILVRLPAIPREEAGSLFNSELQRSLQSFYRTVKTEISRFFRDPRASRPKKESYPIN